MGEYSVVARGKSGQGHACRAAVSAVPLCVSASVPHIWTGDGIEAAAVDDVISAVLSAGVTEAGAVGSLMGPWR